MSYILDALRRAEADRERERGQVPGLHTQPLPGKEAAGQRRWLPWAGGGLLLLAGIGAGSWWASGQREAVPPAPAAASAPVASALPPSESASAAAPAPVAASAPTVQPAASTSPYLPSAPPAAAPVPRPAPAPAPAVAATPAPAVPAAPAPPAAEAPLPRLAELPESIRREVPRLVISGSVYSEEPSGRFAMINGEVLREGAQLGPDFVLEQIRPRELVLRFKGQRYRHPV